MKKWLLILLPALILSCSRTASESIPEPSPAAENAIPSTIPGQLQILFTEELTDIVEPLSSDRSRGAVPLEKLAATKSASDLSAALRSLGAVSLERVFPYDPVHESRQRAEGMHRWYKLTYDPAAQDATKAVSDIRMLPGVESVQAPRSRRPADVRLPFNDPQALAYQWTYYNDGSLDKRFMLGADINVVPVWRLFTGGSPDVVVAVIDGGVDPSHPDLSPVLIPAGPEGSKNFCPGPEFELIPYDHGTHVAGTIGAVNNNGQYVCGVAGGLDGNGGVRLLSCGCFMFDPKSPDPSKPDDIEGDIAAAIVWACNHGALICNNSWSYVYEHVSEAAEGGIDEVDKLAIDYFIKYAGCDNDGRQLPGSLMKGGLVVFAAGNDGWEYGWPAQYEPVVAVGSLGPDGDSASYSNYGSWVDICAPGGEYERFSKNIAAVCSTTPLNGNYVYPGGRTGYDFFQGTSMACPHVSGVAALILSQFGGSGFTCGELRERLIQGADRSAISRTRRDVGPALDAYGSFIWHNDDIRPSDPVTDWNVKVSGRHASVTCRLPRNSGSCEVFVSTDSSLLEEIGAVTMPPGVNTYYVKGEPGGSAFLDLDLEYDTAYYARVHTVGKGAFSEPSEIKYFRTGSNTPPEVTMAGGNCVLSSLDEMISFNPAYNFSDNDPGSLSYEVSIGSPKVLRTSWDGDELNIYPAAYGTSSVTVTAIDDGGLRASYTFEVVVRDGSVPVDVWPNPVKTTLNVAAGRLMDLRICLKSASGNVLLEDTVECSSFSPVQIDMSSCAPGIYSLSVTLPSGKVSQNQVIKQ